MNDLLKAADMRALSCILVLVLAALSLANAATPASKFTVRGTVFCDACSANTISHHTYFLPDVDVHVECILKAASSSSSKRLHFNAKTDKNGVYEVEVPSFDGFHCEKDRPMCRATLVRSPSSLCNAPGVRTSAGNMQVIASEEDQQCSYSMKELSYRPSKREDSCDKKLDDPNNFFFHFRPIPPFFLPHPPFHLPPFPHFPHPPSSAPGNGAPGPSSPGDGTGFHLPPWFHLPPFPHLPPWLHLPFPPHHP